MLEDFAVDGMQLSEVADRLSVDGAVWRRDFPASGPEEIRAWVTKESVKNGVPHATRARKFVLNIALVTPGRTVVSPMQASATAQSLARGSNENTNGLLRQYFPRATNLSHVSQAQLNAVALRLNQRPRKILDFETPADRLQKVLR